MFYRSFHFIFSCTTNNTFLDVRRINKQIFKKIKQFTICMRKKNFKNWEFVCPWSLDLGTGPRGLTEWLYLAFGTLNQSKKKNNAIFENVLFSAMRLLINNNIALIFYVFFTSNFKIFVLNGKQLANSILIFSENHIMECFVVSFILLFD